MTTVYLFRIDGAKDNDEYFAALRSSVAHVYAGTNFCVGKGWSPDLVKVVVEDEPDRCGITLIELEPTSKPATLFFLPNSICLYSLYAFALIF